MGTWCSDSQRDIPALYRILDQLDFDQENLEIIAVDRSKTLPEAELEGVTLEYVPMTIIYKQNEEVGRIVEFPETTLEEDMLGMLSNETG